MERVLEFAEHFKHVHFSQKQWKESLILPTSKKSTASRRVFEFRATTCAQLGLEASKTAPHLRFVLCVVWSSVGVGTNTRNSG